MGLTAGTKLGPYEIQSLIGAGGMGEVYRARDTRLQRDVAIKVLPSSLANDQERLRRFEQEARAVAALNHPNLLTVFDVGTAPIAQEGADGSAASSGTTTAKESPYIVSELLEGATLREKLSAGALRERKALDYAVQIARGLAAAHERGIVHRDLKPENIFITNDGRAKILDFGLAKLSEPAPADANATMRASATQAGIVMGTIGYMSPEQVRGKPADARSDIFSFGVVVYEMLAGKKAFHGDTGADLMSAILTQDPAELRATNTEISPTLGSSGASLPGKGSAAEISIGGRCCVSIERIERVEVFERNACDDCCARAEKNSDVDDGGDWRGGVRGGNFGDVVHRSSDSAYRAAKIRAIEFSARIRIVGAIFAGWTRNYMRIEMGIGFRAGAVHGKNG